MKTAHLWIVVAALALFGCGNNNDNNTNIQFEPDMGMDASDGVDESDADNNTNNVPDMDDPDGMPPVDMGDDMGMVTTCGGVVCDPGYTCTNNVCMLTSSCGSAHDLGVLPVTGSAQVIEDSLVTNGVADLEAACIGDEFTSGRDRVFRFELEQQALVAWTFDQMGQYDSVVELRTDCEDVLSALECEDNEQGSRVLDPGEYFLVLDQKFGNAGAFTLTISASVASCTPGTRTCDPDDATNLLICQAVDQEIIADCPGNCANSTCPGTVCNNAILASAGGTFAGDGRAYVPGAMDFGTNMNCTDMADPGNPISTPGYEVVFYLPGLTAGEIVSIDALTNDTNINAIFIIQQCGDTGTCAAAYKNTEQPDWVVTANGNYYVIIEKRSPTNNRFNYTLNVL